MNKITKKSVQIINKILTKYDQLKSKKRLAQG